MFEVSIRNSEFYIKIWKVIYYIKIQLTCTMNNIYYTPSRTPLTQTQISYTHYNKMAETRTLQRSSFAVKFRNLTQVDIVLFKPPQLQQRNAD